MKFILKLPLIVKKTEYIFFMFFGVLFSIHKNSDSTRQNKNLCINISLQNQYWVELCSSLLKLYLTVITKLVCFVFLKTTKIHF